MGKNEKIKYTKNCSFNMQFNIKKTDFLTFYKTSINVCIYESGLIKDKFRGDFDINLSVLQTKHKFSQKCEIHLENKTKGVYSSVTVCLEPEFKNHNLNNKQINKPKQTISNPQVEKKQLNNINKKEENNKAITELNKKIAEINKLKKLLTEKEKRLTEENHKNQELKEELSKTKDLLKKKKK